MPSIIIFPGQGSQFVGMGRRLLGVPKVERMFELASKVFQFDVLDLCLNGPKSELDKTSKCQVAVFVTSMGAVELLKQTNPDAVKQCYATAGFSIGEYASLVLADAIKFEDALQLIKVRSEAMQRASEAVPSGLMSVFLSRESQLKMAMLAARKWCTDKLKLDVPVECSVANYLFSQCRVIGGNREALEFVELNRDEFKLKRVKHLPVSGAFHTSLMRSAEEEMRKPIENTAVRRPIIRFYSNYDASLAMTPRKIRYNLTRQISNPVKWEQILNTFYLDENLKTVDEEELESKKSNEEEEEDEETEKKKPTHSKKGNEEEEEESEKKKAKQSPDRIYPDIYECGPASQTGPILKVINRKAHQFYKHIEV